MEVLERILRYETKLGRQLYRAMSHLERTTTYAPGRDILAAIGYGDLGEVMCKRVFAKRTQTDSNCEMRGRNALLEADK